MSKRIVEFFVVDLLIAMDKVKRYTQEFSIAEEFLHDEKSFDATMRELEIIGEATKYLLKDQVISSDWQIVVDFRNVIIHEYFGVDIDEVWEVVTKYIIDYKKVIEKVIKTCDKEILLKAFESAKNDFSYNIHIVSMLDKHLLYIKDEIVK